MYDANYLAARGRMESKIGFFSHLAAYLCVNTGLIALSLLRRHAGLWLLGALPGWEWGWLIHALQVFLRWPCALERTPD
jgi:hypothetical protein